MEKENNEKNIVESDVSKEQLVEMTMSLNRKNWDAKRINDITLVTLYESILDKEETLFNYDKLIECANKHGLIPGVKVRVAQADDEKDSYVWVDIPSGHFSGKNIVEVMGRALQHMINHYVYYRAICDGIEKEE